MTSKIYPRSPYATLGGYVHLPRFIDKARLHRQGLLLGYNYKTSGFDRHLLAFLGVAGEEFEAAVDNLGSDDQVLAWLRKKGVNHTPSEIEAWNQAMIAKAPDSPDKRERFSQLLRHVGGSENSGVRTYFDLIDFEERRMEFEARRAQERGSC
ncbi:MAG: DUF5069 domain-containing protein [Verrucomicrobia bacterium]|nr:DUF5069 domain-containing protein [Verrucomicrobiota bacterium]